MSIKDIAVFVLSTAEDEAAIAAAETIARRSDADLAAILLELQPDPIYTTEGMLWAEMLMEARKGFAEEKAALEARRRASDRSIVVRELLTTSGLASAEAAVHARHADLSVMRRPGDEATGAYYRDAIFQGVLFGSGRPVLLIPPDWRGGRIGAKVMVAWNGKRESARALADAAPFLEAADAVCVVTVDAKPGFDGVGPAPGADIAAHLARRGLNVELRNIDGLGHDAEDVLIAAADEIGADLIVMGGYGRARFSEMVFGGVTRAMAAKAPLPVLTSH